MIKPLARLWAGALVLGAANFVLSAPVNIRFEIASVSEPTASAPRVVAAVAPERESPVIDSANWSLDIEHRAPVRTVMSRLSADNDSVPLAVPLPPALWPAAATLAAVAIGGHLRKHARR
jgi:hypothetical protein